MSGIIRNDINETNDKGDFFYFLKPRDNIEFVTELDICYKIIVEILTDFQT
jgi:hypothetical protein